MIMSWSSLVLKFTSVRLAQSDRQWWSSSVSKIFLHLEIGTNDNYLSKSCYRRTLLIIEGRAIDISTTPLSFGATKQTKYPEESSRDNYEICVCGWQWGLFCILYLGPSVFPPNSEVVQNVRSCERIYLSWVYRRFSPRSRKFLPVAIT